MIAADWIDTVLRGDPAPWRALDASNTGLLAVSDTLEVCELLHHQTTGNQQSDDWPIEVRRALARRGHASAARQLVRTREIANVLHALASRGIRPIVFKGAALSHLVYDSAGLRPHADTDLFVRRAEIEAVRQVLTERGYSEPSMTNGELVFCQFQMARTDELGVQHVFDVHWKISTQSLFANLLTYDEMDSEAEPIEALGPEARGAGGRHALLLACIHPVMHHRNAERLIWLYDIHLLVSRMPAVVIRRFASMAVGKGVAGICARQLTITSDHFHTPVPVDVLSTLLAGSERERSSIYLRPGRRWHHEVWWNVRGLGNWRDRLRLVREVLFPSPRYMLHAYHLGASGVLLLPALYVHRGLYGMFKIIVGRK